MKWNDIWLKKEHEYHYISEIKCEKEIFFLKMAANTSFVTSRNNA